MSNPNSRHARLNHIATILNASRYLEIGVSKGITFNNVDIVRKVAVDPVFRFDISEHSSGQREFHEVTSDHYFSSIASKDDIFDLIYLDGLHTFEQTFRDFCASLAHAHSRTVWVIDDTIPISLAAAEPDRQAFRALKSALKDARPHWMGDVYKVVFAIHDFFPQFSYASFREGHGQTVVWRKARPSFSPALNSLEAISRSGYDQFLLLSHKLMNITQTERIYNEIEASLGS